MVSTVSSAFSLSPDQIASFKTRGFLFLKGVFTPEFIGYIKNKIEQDLLSPTDKYQTGFNRVKYDLFEFDEQIQALMKSPDFRKIMKALTGRDMLYIQGLGFELKKNESKGFPWHIGTQSFGYQHWDDFGCTIWTPLAQINAQAQRGGMAYVPKNRVSGEFLYSHIDPSVFRLTEEKITNKEDFTVDQFVQLRDGPLNDPAMKALLDYYGVEDNFELGDALIFDKYVIHRSVMLEEGPLDYRIAFAMRFADSASTYDYQRAHALEIPRDHFKYSGPTRFHLNVADKEGMPLVDSPLFKDDLDIRWLK